ncbi:MAG: insulinase family protein [Melioribacteraceae bacterium]|nr:insulinase family protein [Melioribacteraceae bacterium]MCF8264394.1 insulinase family protein [Melioribacteraceae bacterium]MCF8413975.1 insulinase family protein [Melioribacteraceae bacterium]
MKGKSLIAVFFILAAFSNLTIAGSNDNILPYPIHQERLENGLNVVTVPFDSPGIASFYIVVRVGARNEVEEGVTGFAHFFEHMMFRGTDKYPKKKYQAALKSIGASANANTSQDRTVYHMTGNANKLDLMFELEADRFQNLNYSEPDFKVEAGAVKGEYTKNNASPYSQLFENLQNTAFDEHTYKHTTMGFFDDIVDMPNQYEYSKEFYDRYYRPEYCTIVVVGDASHEKVMELTKKYFGNWERGSYVSEVPTEPKQTETRYTHLKNGSIPPFMMLAFKGPAFNDKEIDMPALDVLSTIVFSSTGDLYKKLVLEERKVRFIGGGAFDSRDPNMFNIQASLINVEDIQYVKDEVMKAIEKVKKEGVDAETLVRTKSNLKYSFAMRIDSPDNIANSLAHYIQLTGDPESLNRIYKLYEKVSVDDIKMVAEKYFVPTGLTIATISPLETGGVK